MAHAWLDSLSEDWVSQSEPDSSAVQLPPLKPSRKNESSPLQRPPSRIPRWTPGAKPFLPSSPAALNERNANDVNISRKRVSSRLSHERKASQSGGASRGRSASTGTTGSVVHNTVQHQMSPAARGNSQTPEWRRRLVNGEFEYGEQRDLFCSAAVGLQDMFKPPNPTDGNGDGNEASDLHETTMPSSPPLYDGAPVDLEMDADFILEDEEPDYPDQVTPSPSPRRSQREVRYKLNVDDSLNTSIISNGSVRKTTASTRPPDDSIYRDQSCLTVPSETETISRKVSGQSDMRNEDFSPILIAKQSDEDGKIEFAPLEMPADQLRQRLERLRINQLLLDPHVDAQACFDNTADEASLNVETTGDFARSGGFINLRRGGRSDEGSFRNRGLSPDLAVDLSEMLFEESLQASTPKHFSTVRMARSNPYQAYNSVKSPAMPRAPFPSPDKRQTRVTIGQSGGSPLKLFGPYDTFTNQTLLRRISQFEEGMSGMTSRQSSVPITDRELNRQMAQQSSPMAGSRAPSQFGHGDFDGYEFTGDLSQTSVDDSALPGKENISPRPPLTTFPGITLPPRGSWSDEESELHVRRSRNKLRTVSGTPYAGGASISSPLKSALSPLKGAHYMAGTPKRDSGSEGKRPRTSPCKDPTPKRRRTLHRSDIAFGNEDPLAAVDSAHRQIQHVMGKQQKKDALPGLAELADPEVLARRSILRTRTTTPSHALSQQRDQRKPKKSPVRAAQDEDNPDVTTETERKPSMRTQDFVDQAAQIMAMIRNQVTQPGLASLEESEAENGPASQFDLTRDFSDGSTAEPLSRPPSRDGKPVSRFPQRQEDPELVKRLKKYQEFGDMGDIISSSVRSMGLAKDAIRAAQEVERMIQETTRRSRGSSATDGEAISDIPNVQISSTPESADEMASPARDFRSSSSGRSTVTVSSRSSESRRVIMPESVSHLIPDRIGGMYLDKQNNIWIKKKETQPDSASIVATFDDSEDDPFASIPDLTVDLTKELQQLNLNTGNHEAAADNSGDTSSESPSLRVWKRSSFNMPADDEVDPDMEARAREEIEKLDLHATDFAAPKADANAHDDRISNPTSTIRRRNLTISFSSPIASVIQDVVAADLDSLEDDPEFDETMRSAGAALSGSPLQTPVAQTSLKNTGQLSMRSHRGIPYHGSARGSAFIPRPVSRIDEQDEESTVEIPITHQNDRQLSIIGDNTFISHRSLDASLGFIINKTPLRHNAMAVQPDDSLLIGRHVGRLSLSPLSEFTLNNADSSFGFEVSYVMGRRRMATGGGSKKVLSMTIRELVDKLAEVEPLEAYWEDMRELDLHDKRLTSLHMLDEFCGKVITLDASKNALRHLDGVPDCVRQLKVSNNMLTELTSWDHLKNLQYVDICGNEVKSLSALKNLVHLRSLKADNNQLTSLDGLDSHDGLLTLRARDNLIGELDFADTKLERMTDLDLEGNRIRSIRRLERLPALSRLNVSKNQLQTLAFGKTVKALRQLDISDNDLTSLDIRNLPNLHTLHADRNRIHDLHGFRHARRMDSLSLREQRGEMALDLSFLVSACELRKLFLSGNYLGSFQPRADFLNLQLLELANCGLQDLPAELGQLMPNLRTLNLNLNAVGNLSPLRFIPRLKKLLAAGNRLMDSTSVTELLTEFPHLTQLDLRDNPITQGLYPSAQLLVTAERAGCDDGFTLPDADAGRDATFVRRLAEPTKLRRRLHEVVFVASCKRLRKLDGLGVRRNTVLVRDALLQTLVDEGLLSELEDTLVAESESPPQNKEATGDREATEHWGEEPESSRWNAEDSFG